MINRIKVIRSSGVMSYREDVRGRLIKSIARA